MVIAVIILSLMPVPPPIAYQVSDKSQHFIAYFVLMAWFLQLAATRQQRLGWLLLFLGLGVAIEYLQGASGYRFFEVADMVANSLGAISAWLLVPLGLDRLLARLEQHWLNRRAHD
jgi:VanZ family protein